MRLDGLLEAGSFNSFLSPATKPLTKLSLPSGSSVTGLLGQPASNNHGCIMTQVARNVTVKNQSNRKHLPKEYATSALVLQKLSKSEFFKTFQERCKVDRQGGYPSIDIFLFFLVYFTSGSKLGIKAFSKRISSHGAKLAAFAGRRRLPSAASVSRFLSKVTPTHIEELSAWLFNHICKESELLKHKTSVSQDANGQNWHIFDLDPSSRVLRQRGLAEGEDLPAGQRRSHELKPGYFGRKRGDVKLSQIYLEHAGTSFWSGLWSGAGNGNLRQVVPYAVKVVQNFCEHLEHPRAQTLIRIDGEGGTIPITTSIIEGGLKFLVRWRKYELLNSPSIRERLNESTWYEVEDSKSGPKRVATDVGWIELGCSTQAVREDGARYQPQTYRVVVSRYKDKNERGAGKLIDGWKYELYVTNLSESDWPAPEVVTAYYGRIGQENRFNQANKDLGINRTFSFHIPGQTFVTSIALFVWNIKIICAETHSQCLPKVPPQESLDLNRAKSVVRLSKNLNTESEDQDNTNSPEITPSSESVERSSEPRLSIPHIDSDPSRGELFYEKLRQLNWNEILKLRTGWSFDQETARLRCPNGYLLPTHSVGKEGKSGRGFIKFRSTVLQCKLCKIRATCTTSINKHFKKEIEISLPNELIRELQELFRLRTRYRSAPQTNDNKCQLATSINPKLKCSNLSKVDSQSYGTLKPRASLLRPAPIRELFTELCRDIGCNISVEEAPTSTGEHPFISPSAARRQNRRKTWQEKNVYNQLTKGSQHLVEFEIPPEPTDSTMAFLQELTASI